MKRALVIGILVALAAAFVGGYWPQRSRAVTAEAETARLTQALSNTEDRVRLGELLGRALRLSDAVAARNYGEAGELSSQFFNAVADEAARNTRPEARDTLNRILMARDPVTTALARSDAEVAVTLREHELLLRQALGYAVP